MFSRINEQESEENLKNIIADFLKEVWYRTDYEINTKDRKDLVIHNGKSATDPVAVIIEAKRPGNKPEMISSEKPNVKAFHELVLYYLRERIDHQNSQIKHLIATNIWDWYLFDGVWFEKNIFRNNKIRAEYEAFKTSGHDTRYFYEEIAAKYLGSLDEVIPVTYFNLKDYEEIIVNRSEEDDIKLIELYKILSPEHLLRKSFANDSNALNKEFYNELLHIIGLGEVRVKSKKLIGRKPEGARDEASLLENAMNILRVRGRVLRSPDTDHSGETEEERLFSAGLELVITWLNRILFLKLLEGQLISYHKGDESYKFLNSRVIEDFDQLNELFFDVLAQPEDERAESVREKFGKLPYLNSSLFEESPLEQSGITIAELKDRLELPIYNSTVLKDAGGRRITGRKKTLGYLFEFLDAYDFSSDSASEIQEENKSLISASVLGLIFEKINGYKDGSFFTPGFITMYMCRETIRRAVLQKFNEAKGWACTEFDHLYDKIEDKKEANDLINSLKICDPAVGSGHFLVSALNEMIAIKSELKIWRDRQGKTLRDYQAEVINDELVVTDDDGRFFRYNPRNEESRRVQEALFHEKQTIIENCLFGVDINPKSVMICRLRLWIELLKNAYYRKPERDSVPVAEQLETLPNLDINIKCGNSLISRFPLDADLGQALRGSRWNMESYRLAVQTYRNAETKEQKRAMEKLIQDIKGNFESEVARNDKRLLRLNRLKGDLHKLTTQTGFFELTKAQKAAWNMKVKKLTAEISQLENALEEVRSNKIYGNAFEWRFEFPEVLDDEGSFTGFDVVIGNPPYGVKFDLSENTLFAINFYSRDDIYVLFIQQGLHLIKDSGFVSLIIPVFWLTGDNYLLTRKFLIHHAKLEIGINLPYDIFLDAYIDTGIYLFSKKVDDSVSLVFEFSPKDKVDFFSLRSIKYNVLFKEEWVQNQDHKIIFNATTRAILRKFDNSPYKLKELCESVRGILAHESDYSSFPTDDIYVPVFVGKLNRYCVELEKFVFVKYGENLIEKPANTEFFRGERILIRRIVNRQFRIMAVLVMDEFVVKKDIYILKLISPIFTSKCLLALINSRLISFIKTTCSVSAKKDDFTQLTLSDIREIGIPDISNQVKNNLESLVDKLLLSKKNSPSSDTSNLEREIDELVYDLYGLTEEERRIVEGGLGI